MASEKEIYLRCKDHSVSGEKFNLLYDHELEMLITHPQPDNLNRYYESLNYISHTDSRRKLSDKLYHGVKKFMLNRKLNWIEQYKSPGKILDIGGGTGDFLLHAKSRGWNVSGIEPNDLARKLALVKGLDMEENASGFSERSFDVITMWHVLEHVSDLDRQISDLHRLLKEDGLLVIAVPNFKSYDARFYKENWAAYDVPRHLWHFSQTAVEKLFSDKGFELFEKKPLKFDAFYVSLLSEKYKTGSANYLKALHRGYLSNQKAKASSEYSSLAYFFRKA